MSDFRKIDARGYRGSKETAGPVPMLQWIALDELHVDDSYQRPIGRRGAATIRAIAAAFDWAKFSPVVVAPAEGGGFSIVDGQHRATAALACGFDKVPCQIILVDRAGQAAAFSDINSKTTPVHSMALHRAAVAAGDPVAIEINRVAELAGVRILPYPVQTLQQKPGETMAIGTIRMVIKAYGEALAVLSLATIREAGGDRPGMLLAPIIRGVALALHRCSLDAAMLDAAARAISCCNLIREFGKASDSAREAGKPVHDLLAARLHQVIAKGAA